MEPKELINIQMFKEYIFVMKKPIIEGKEFHLLLFYQMDLFLRVFSYPYLFVGIKIVLKNDRILGLYISKRKTMLNTNQYIADKNIAKKIKTIIKKKRPRLSN